MLGLTCKMHLDVTSLLPLSESDSEKVIIHLLLRLWYGVCLEQVRVSLASLHLVLCFLLNLRQSEALVC